jgi:redox-sensitive bicupin YhaK (pirin superfamily)
VPLEPDFEYAALLLSGGAELAGHPMTLDAMVYLGRGRSDVSLRARTPSRVLLLGGEPFGERLLMWWNFVARTHEEIVEAREDWMAGRVRFGTVVGYDGDPLPAPPTPTTRLRPRGPTA